MNSATELVTSRNIVGSSSILECKILFKIEHRAFFGAPAAAAFQLCSRADSKAGNSMVACR
jgi:hypothetical protein